MCTSATWPSDLAPFLWHHYGGYAHDLDMFKQHTRELLGEYTEHYKRQRIEDESTREARGATSEWAGLEMSLANPVHADWLSRVMIPAGGVADVQAL